MIIVRHSFTITPHDVDNLPYFPKQVYVTGAGDIKLALQKDEDVDAITIAVTAGQILSGWKIRKVFATGTTATGLIGLY